MDSGKNLTSLKQHYRNNPVVLYTGAGVSQTDCIYGLESWEGLLRKIYTHGAKGDEETFNKKWNRLSDSWKVADWIVSECPGEDLEAKVARFQGTLTGIVRQTRNFTKAHRQLSLPFLNNAKTLNAITAFCCCLRGRVKRKKQDPPKKPPNDIRFAIALNPRVKAVLTSNYDPFLEVASTTKFIRPRLKSVSALGSLAGNLHTIPVFHAHGYVPHPYQKRKGVRVPYVKNLVLTRAEYKRAWNPQDVYGITMAYQIHYLRHYVTLFIGFSFADVYICELLAKLKDEFLRSKVANGHSHFAVLTAEDYLNAGGDICFKAMGVKPIFCEADYSNIPDLLGRLYTSGLKGADDGKVSLPRVTPRTHEPNGRPLAITKSTYWNALLECRNSAIPRGKFK